jgi:hypothetical protein
VAVVSAADIWAAGYYYGHNGSPYALIEQWNGTSWNLISSPNSGVSLLDGIASVAANDIWTVGYVSPGASQELTLTERYH